MASKENALQFTQKKALPKDGSGLETMATIINTKYKVNCYPSTLEYTTPSLYTIISTQEGAQRKERNTLGDHKDHKHSLGDLKRSQTIFSQNKDPKDRNRINSSNM